jgi:hypothetical protein
MKTSDIVAKISSGLTRTNRFTVSLRPPQFILNNAEISNANLQNILLLCDTVSLPSAMIATSQNRIFGEIREIPTELQYAPIQMTFLVDINMNVKKLFDDWIIYGVQQGNTRSFNYYNDYIAEMDIFVQDVEDGNRYVVYLYEAYPKSIGPIQLDYASRDMMKVTVDMQYKFWRSERQVPANTGFSTLGWEAVKYAVDNPDMYTNNFKGFQENVNQNLSVTPETLANTTTTAPVGQYW